MNEGKKEYSVALDVQNPICAVDVIEVAEDKNKQRVLYTIYADTPAQVRTIIANHTCNYPTMQRECRERALNDKDRAELKFEAIQDATLKLVERMLKEEEDLYYDMNEFGKSDFHVAIGEAVQEVVDTALEPD